MIKIRTSGLEELQEFIAELPRGIRIAGMREASEYLIGNSQHGLKHEPSYRFVSRADAYGKVSDAPAGYFSWAQFRYVAAITEGFTRAFTRTHEIVNGWYYQEANSDWNRVDLMNDVPGAEWVVGDSQARQPAKAGWRHYLDVINSNMTGAIQAAQRAVDEWVNRNG